MKTLLEPTPLGLVIANTGLCHDLVALLRLNYEFLNILFLCDDKGKPTRFSQHLAITGYHQCLSRYRCWVYNPQFYFLFLRRGTESEQRLAVRSVGSILKA